MENQDYLKQISSEIRPAKKSKMSFLKSKYFLIVAGGVALFILIAIIGSAISGGKLNVKDQSIALKLHVDNTLEVVSTFQPNLKSSSLRSSSASLSSILSNTSRDLLNYLSDAFSYKDGSASSNLTESAKLAKDGLESELFEAKINGILDRIYAHKMAYEISLLTTEESNIYNATSSEALRTLLSNSYTSLNNLYNNFKDFSETK